MGEIYELGKLGPPNFTAAMQWYEKSVNLGNSRGHAEWRLGKFYLGNLLLSFFCVFRKNDKKMFFLLLKFIPTEKGKGISRNLQKACELFQKSANFGNPIGQVRFLFRLFSFFFQFFFKILIFGVAFLFQQRFGECLELGFYFTYFPFFSNSMFK